MKETFNSEVSLFLSNVYTCKSVSYRIRPKEEAEWAKIELGQVWQELKDRVRTVGYSWVVNYPQDLKKIVLIINSQAGFVGHHIHLDKVLRVK